MTPLMFCGRNTSHLCANASWLGPLVATPRVDFHAVEHLIVVGFSGRGRHLQRCGAGHGDPGPLDDDQNQGRELSTQEQAQSGPTQCSAKRGGRQGCYGVAPALESINAPKMGLLSAPLTRQALAKDRTAAQNRQKQARVPLLKRQCASRLRHIERQLEALETEMLKHVKSDPAQARAFEILKSIPGNGAITAVAVLAEMPEIGSLDPKAAASLAGLAPITRQSGTWQGRSFVQGGRRRVRQALYMPAVSAISCNPDLARKYRQLCTAGKHPRWRLPLSCASFCCLPMR